MNAWEIIWLLRQFSAERRKINNKFREEKTWKLFFKQLFSDMNTDGRNIMQVRGNR